MQSCLNCGRRVDSTVGFDCLTDDGKRHNILVTKQFTSDRDIKEALLNSGNSCGIWQGSTQKNKLPLKMVSSQIDEKEQKIIEAYDKHFQPAKTGKINWRMWGGWVLAAFYWAILITLLLLGWG